MQRRGPGAAYCSERCHRADGWRRKADTERAPYMKAAHAKARAAPPSPAPPAPPPADAPPAPPSPAPAAAAAWARAPGAAVPPVPWAGGHPQLALDARTGQLSQLSPAGGGAPLPPWAAAAGLGLVAPGPRAPFWVGGAPVQLSQVPGGGLAMQPGLVAAAAAAQQQQRRAADARRRADAIARDAARAPKRSAEALGAAGAPPAGGGGAKRHRGGAQPVTPEEPADGAAPGAADGARVAAALAEAAAPPRRLPGNAAAPVHSAPGLLLRAGDGRLAGALSAPAFNEDDVSDAWRDARALIVRVGRDGASGSPVAAASRSLDELLASRAEPGPDGSPGASFARRFAEKAKAAIAARGADGALTLGWGDATFGDGAGAPGAATRPMRLRAPAPARGARRAEADLRSLEDDFLAPLLETLWALQVAAASAVPPADAERLLTDRSLAPALRYPSPACGWNKVSVHVSVVRRHDDRGADAPWDGGATACPGHVDAFGVSPILVLNVGDSYVPGGRLCLLEAAGCDGGARPIVVPTDASRAVAVFADFARRHGQLPFERPSRAARDAPAPRSELLRVSVLPYCTLGCVRWTRCMAQKVAPSPDADRWANCDACDHWCALAPGDVAPGPDDDWTCARCAK